MFFQANCDHLEKDWNAMECKNRKKNFHRGTFRKTVQNYCANQVS